MKKTSIFIVICLFLINMNIVFASTIPPKDCIASWDFDALNGDKIKDISNHEFDGVLNGIAINEEAAYTKHYGLNGNGTQRMDVPTLGVSFAHKNTLSYVTWLNPQICDKERTIFSISNQAGGLGLSANILVDGRILLQFRKTNTTSGGLVNTGASSAPKIPLKQWSHCVFTFELPKDTAQKAKMKIYINGNLEKEAEVSSDGLSEFSHFEGANPTNDFRVGGHASSSYIGYSDDIKVFDRALTQEEITLLSTIRQESKPTKFTIGDRDILSLDDAKVEDFDAPGAKIYVESFPLKGIDIAFAYNSFQSLKQLFVNNVAVEDYENILIYADDVVTFEYYGDYWESDKRGKYKVIVCTSDMYLTDCGFYRDNLKLDEISAGNIIAMATVSTKLADDKKVSLISVLKQNNKVYDVKIADCTLTQTSGTGYLKCELDIPDDNNTYSLEMYIIDDYLAPLFEIISE